MITDDTKKRILSRLTIEKVLTDIGCTLRKSGVNYICKSPLRDDKHTGSFIVNTRKNIAKDFATGEKAYDPLQLVMEYYKMDFEKALRYAAALTNTYIDEAPTPKTRTKSGAKPIVETRLPIQMWVIDHEEGNDIVTPFTKLNHLSPLMRYIEALHAQAVKSLGVSPKAFQRAKTAYSIGTYPSGSYEGWSIWWYIDHLGYVRTGKMMAYKDDGHRNKDTKPSFTWVHSITKRWKERQDGTEYENPNWKWDNHTHDISICLFGQQLVDIFPKAVIRLVESEKTAVICSMFNDMRSVIWLASGGKSMMTDERLLPILKKGRTIELFPDIDGYDEWAAQVQQYKTLKPYIESGHLRVSDMVRRLWKPEDGPKADIADIMIRLVTTPQMTTGDKVAAQFGEPDKAELVDNLITTLDLRIV